MNTGGVMALTGTMAIWAIITTSLFPGHRTGSSILAVARRGILSGMSNKALPVSRNPSSTVAII
ncbi:MAG: hypothetical protein HKP56_12850 [Anderseniella sp.]|nr:hypothetical protein [Anderseniella sp.]